MPVRDGGLLCAVLPRGRASGGASSVLDPGGRGVMGWSKRRCAGQKACSRHRSHGTLACD